MLGLKLSKIFVMLSALVFVTVYAQQPVNSDAISQLKIMNLSQPTENVFASGQPTKEELSSLAQSGIKHIINLRPLQEQDWDEAEYVESLGMQYHLIPVAGAVDITVENATKLSALLKQVGSDKTLVHCSSSNRVGALIALSEGVLNGRSVEESITQGKRWGLTTLEPVVRKEISSPQLINK